MKVQALRPLTIRDGSTGALTAVACGQVVDLDSTLANALISDGLVEAYTLVNPTGTKSITENGENIDVASYAKANVAVPSPVEVQTIAGTASNPFGTIDYDELAEALANNGATAKITMSGTPSFTAVMSSFEGRINAECAYVETASILGYKMQWAKEEGQVYLNQYFSNDGTVYTDFSLDKASQVSSLTVVWHSLS